MAALEETPEVSLLARAYACYSQRSTIDVIKGGGTAA
jgi:hypothetical protein